MGVILVKEVPHGSTEYAIQAFQRGDWMALRAPGSGKNRWKFWAVRREGVSTTRV